MRNKEWMRVEFRRGEIEQVIKSGARKVNKKRKVITYTGRYLTVLMAPDSNRNYCVRN